MEAWNEICVEKESTSELYKLLKRLNIYAKYPLFREVADPMIERVQIELDSRNS